MTKDEVFTAATALKDIRKAQGLQQYQLSEKMEFYTRACVSLYENKPERASIEYVVAARTAMNVLEIPLVESERPDYRHELRT